MRKPSPAPHMAPPPLQHGGRLALALQRYPGAPRPFIDLSTGINPVAYPVPALPVEVFARLPEPEALAALEALARACYGAPHGADVIAVPGTEAAIRLLPRLVEGDDRVTILGPTYASHARAWAGAEVVDRRHWQAGDAALPMLSTRAPNAVIVRPNNPDGYVAPAAGVAELAAALGKGPGLLILDEAFVDAEPEVSLVRRALEFPALVILRSFGKFYGLAGVRLGFVITAHPIGGRLRAALGDWPVSGAAIAIGTKALADAGWSGLARERLMAASQNLGAVLHAGGLEAHGGTALFRYAGHLSALHMQDRLAHAGILVRAFPGTNPDRLRFGLPGDATTWDRLRETLARYRTTGR